MSDELSKLDLQVVGEKQLISVEPAERRMIAVIEESELPKVVSDETKWKGLGGWRNSVEVLWGGLTRPITTQLQLSIDVVDALLRLRRRLSETGNDILPVASTKLADFQFPPGHPRIGAVYAAHPTKSQIYYPIADFHRLNFEAKINEAVLLLMSLGANKINVSHITGWSRDFAAQIAVAAPENMAVDGGIEKERSLAGEVLFTASLSGSNDPKLPDDLAWFDYEPTWQSVAEGRLKHGLEDFHIVINYNDDFGVNAALKSEILKSGLKLSGKFTEHSNTIWTMTGKFGAKQ